ARLRHRAPDDGPDDVQGHVIRSGWDDIAPGLSERLRVHGTPLYVLEADPEEAARMHGDGIPVVRGEQDARVTYERVRAGSARMLVANGGDAANTNVILTVREVAPDLPIVALATAADAVDILQLSGATHVLSLKRQLGEQLANRVNAGHAQSHKIGRYGDLHIAEFPVHNTPLVGRTLRQSRLREYTGVSVIGVWERGHLLPPSPDAPLTSMSVPVVVGTEEQIEELDAFLVIYESNFNPVVVLGGGRVGAAAVLALREKGVASHLGERDPAVGTQLTGLADELFIGDAADRQILKEAGIDEAPSVILTTHDDATNIYLAAYCRRLNPSLRIISRVTHERNVEAVVRAGADLALSYASLGVESIVALLRGREIILLGEGIDIFRMPAPPSLHGRTLAESDIGARTGATVVAMQNGGGLLLSPDPSTRIDPSSELLLVAGTEQRERFLRYFT
ncbi:MAG TPA: NAD-binding protein, partial [Longimicrobiales bacterium]|nr:NAD-binding protein [Longimicrobiales bacterium]